MTLTPGPIHPHHAGGPSRVIQGFFPGGRPRIIQASPGAVSPVRPQAQAQLQARTVSAPAPIVPGRPRGGALLPAVGAGHRGRPILPAQARPGALQPATPTRPQPPQPIQPHAAKPTAVQPHGGGDAFALPAGFTLKPHGSGQPLPEPIQKKMESFFNTSFAEVRIHVGPEASSIGALAFTHGTDLYFSPGQYNPQSTPGQQLLGHELTHVVQQRAGRVRNPLGAGVAVVQDPALEAEAERMGLRAASAAVPIQAKPASAGPGGGTPRATGLSQKTFAANGAILPALSPTQSSLQRKPGPILPGRRSAAANSVPKSIPPMEMRAASLSVQPKLATAASQRSALNSVIQMAGTKPRVFSKGDNGRYLVKLTSPRENFIFTNRAAVGVAGVTAEYYEPLECETRVVPGKYLGSWSTDTIISRVKINKDYNDVWIQLPTAPGEGLQVPKPGQEVLIIDTIGWKAGGRTANEKKLTFVMDIKVGTYTKSGEQFNLEGANWAEQSWKKFEHNIKDTMQRESRGVGYDICQGGEDFDKAYTDSRDRKNTVNFTAALTKIVADTRTIRVAVKNSVDSGNGLVYVGASVFCFFDLHNPAASTAKLIDPDHPIFTGAGIPQNKPADVMDKGTFDLSGTGRNWDEYTAKWESAFLDGMDAVIRYFRHKARNQQTGRGNT